MRFLSFDGAGGDAFDDIAREEDVHEQHRQDGEQDEHIDLAEVKFRVIRRAKLRDHDGDGLHFRFIEQQRGQEIVVPRLDKREDQLHGNGGLQHGQHDAVEGKELARAVDTRGLHDLHGQDALHVLDHVEEHDRRRDAGEDQRQIAVRQLQLVAQLDKACGGDLLGNDHDGHDEQECEPLELKIVGVQAVGGQRGKIGGQDGRRGCDDKAVEHAARDVDGAVVPRVFEILQKMSLRQRLEAALQICVGPGRVDDQHIEREQAEDRQKDQQRIDQHAADGQHGVGFAAVRGILLHCERLLSFLPASSAT